ncbi:MAG: nuclear transport factor 2 family protein, partial [Bacteroidota bacterium]|nr:nuclear transport factor 2 family protein [Bacteroidota bacterium]
MKIFIVFALFITTTVSAQTSFLKEAAIKLEKALIQKDTVTLKQLLHNDVSYGHSNGWVETKGDIIKDLYNGKLAYKKIEHKSVIWAVGPDWGTVRSTDEINYILDGKPATLKLHVLNVWLKTGRG